MNPVTIHVVRPPLSATPSRLDLATQTAEQEQPPRRAFAMQSLGITGRAFVMPMLAGCCLPPAYRFLGTFGAGLCYAHICSNPLPLAFRPQPTTEQSLIGPFIGFMPFAGTYLLQTKMQGMSRFDGLSAAIGDGWSHLSARLPAAVGRSFPIQFALARACAQGSAAVTGGVLQYEYLSRATGGEIERRPAHENNAESHKLMDPLVGTVALSLFSIPAALNTPAAVKMMGKAMSPLQQTAVSVSATILAAWGTKAASLAAQQPGDDHQDPPAGDSASTA